MRRCAGLSLLFCVAAGAHERLQFARFFELSCARCGSTFVDEMLASHPCVLSVGEKIRGAVDEVRRVRAKRLGGKLTADDLRKAQDFMYGDIEDQAQRSFERGAELRASGRVADASFEGCAVVLVGGKLPYERLRLPTQNDRFEDVLSVFTVGPSPRVIFNLRTNSLDRVLSRAMGSLFGADHGCVEGPDECLRTKSTAVDAEWLVKEMCENNATVAKLREDVLEAALKVGAPFLGIRYEDLLRDPAASFADDVLPFLGLGPTALSARHVKRTANLTHADMIENFPVVAAAVRAAGFGDALVDEATRAAPRQTLLLNAPPGYSARGATTPPRDWAAMRGA